MNTVRKLTFVLIPWAAFGAVSNHWLTTVTLGTCHCIMHRPDLRHIGIQGSITI